MAKFDESQLEKLKNEIEFLKNHLKAAQPEATKSIALQKQAPITAAMSMKAVPIGDIISAIGIFICCLPALIEFIDSLIKGKTFEDAMKIFIPKLANCFGVKIDPPTP
jgi:hypothetical protein